MKANHNKQGHSVKILPNIKDKSSVEYEKLFGRLKNTIYKNTCPDFTVDDIFYEHEGYVTDNTRRALKNMLSRGFGQSSRVIINDTEDKIWYIRQRIYERIEKGQKIDEVWILKKGGEIQLIYKKQDPIN